MTKDNVYNILITKGRELVRDNGAEFLTARKLSTATRYSVGTIYNQFGNMDNYIQEQNIITLNELHSNICKIMPDSNDYKNLNRYVDAFVEFVLDNKNLWFLLYDFHLKAKSDSFSRSYLRSLIAIIKVWEVYFNKVFSKLNRDERKIGLQVLWLSIFSVSSFLTNQSLNSFSKVNKHNICKLLLNTYLAGLKTLSRD